MDTATLVNFDIEQGQKVIDALDQDGKSPDVAMWAKFPEFENWRLVIASDQLDQSSALVGYTQINETLKRLGIPLQRRVPLFLRPVQRPFIQALRLAFSSAEDTYGMRLGGQMFGDQYLEDAFVYRIR
jgi:hypothetical protein